MGSLNAVVPPFVRAWLARILEEATLPKAVFRQVDSAGD